MTIEELVRELAARARVVGLCGHIGPAPGPDMPPYFCTLPIDHAGVHMAKDILDSGNVYDSWVQ